MLDKLFVRNNLRKDVYTPEYSPEQAVKGWRLVNPDASRLTVLFPPWHGGGKSYERLVSRLAQRGNAVVAFYFHDEILKPDVEKVAASFARVRDVVSGNLTILRAAHEYEHVRLMAMSLGNSALAIVTSEFKDFNSATLVTAGSSLAKSMWYGSRTQQVRAGIEEQGYSLGDVEAAWADLAPMNHLDALVGKDVNLLLSMDDTVIPTSYQMELLEASQAAGIDPDVQQSQLGHYGTIGKFCLFNKVQP